MAHELYPLHVAVVSIWPPLTRTEKVLTHPQSYPMNRSRSPLLTGRAVAALAADPHIMTRTGRTLTVEQVADE